MRLTVPPDTALKLAKVSATNTGAITITSADINAWARTTSVDYDDLIAECVDLAEQEFNLSIVAKTIVATYYGSGGNVARLSYGPVIAVSSVTADGVAVDSDNYELIGNEVIFDFGQRETIVVTYTTGYASLPVGLELALKKMILSNNEDRQDNLIATFVAHFPNHSRRQFMKYKNY